jgi:hypothetical protein
MKIIQSFAEFENGNFYLDIQGSEWNNKYLNFYSFLLSYLTLKKYYGGVTMYCNQKAYDSFIKYIPYDEVKIVENGNDFTFWSYYKVDIMKRMRSDFIHVDSDVFIFDDLFTPFNNSDIIVQDKICLDGSPLKEGVPIILNYLKSEKILDVSKYDGKFLSCGVVGMRNEIKKRYVVVCDALKKGYVEKKFNVDKQYASILIEELPMHLIALDGNYKVHEILPHDEIIKRGAIMVGNDHKYTHMWFGSKFNPQYVKAMKLKIRKEFPLYGELIDRFESEVLDKVMV